MANHLLTNVGVYALIIENKKLLMLHKPNDPIWILLGGRMNEDEEDPITALEREIKEEIGQEVIVGDIFDAKLWSINGKGNRLGIFYLCKLDKKIRINLSEEHDKYKFFTFKEGIDMCSLETRGEAGVDLFKKLKNKKLIG